MSNERTEPSLKQRQDYLLKIYKAFAALCEKYDIPYYAHGGTAIGAVRHQGFIPWDDDIDVFLLREDYLRLREVADAELEGTDYRIYSCETELDCCSLMPCFVDTSTLYIARTMRANNNPKYQKLNIDLFVYENVPEDEKAFKRYATKAWVLGKLFYISLSPYPNVPIKNKVLKKLCQAALFALHYVLKLPFFHDRIVRSLTRHCAKYCGKTSRYALLIDTWPTEDSVSKEDLFPPVKMRFEDIEVDMPKNYDELLRSFYDDYMAIPPESERKIHPIYFLRLDAEEDGAQ
jgi:lipopolysaccharide cholinephosphotransferase